MKTFWTRCVGCNGVVKVLLPKKAEKVAPANCRRCDGS